MASVELVLRRDEVLGREDLDLVQLAQHLAGQRVDLGDALDLVAEELDAVRQVGVGGHHLERVAAHAELAAPQLQVVALVEDVDQLAQHQLAARAARRGCSLTVTRPYSAGSPRP